MAYDTKSKIEVSIGVSFGTLIAMLFTNWYGLFGTGIDGIMDYIIMLIMAPFAGLISYFLLTLYKKKENN